MDPLKRVIEALLFSSERPLSAAECVKYLKAAPDNAPAMRAESCVVR